MKTKTNVNMKLNGIVISAVIIASVLAAFSTPTAAEYTYDGYEVKTMTNGTVQGDVFASYGDRHGVAHGRTDRGGPYRTNYSLPNGNDVRWARLFVGVWGGREVNSGWLNTTLHNGTQLNYLGNVSLGSCNPPNGTNDTNPIYNQTQPSVYGTGHGCWMVAYNVTHNVSLNAWNNVTATTYTCAPSDLDGRIYGIVLVVVYENESLAKVQYWINEGNVNLNYITPLNNTVTRFNSTAYNSTEANLTVVYYAGTADENDYLFLNAPNDTGTSPGNVSQSNIGWDNGSSYWRYQMDNRNVADERVDSCSGSGCCCDDNSINSYGFDFNCFSKTNDSNYMVKDIINTSVANSNYAIFWRGHDDNGNGTIDSSWAASGVEGEAYVHPIVAVLRLDLDYDVSITATPDTRTVAPDEDATYTITITNTGNISDTYDLTLTPGTPAPDYYALSGSSSITLALGESGERTLTVRDSDAGTYDVTVKAVSQADATVEAEVTTTTTVE